MEKSTKKKKGKALRIIIIFIVALAAGYTFLPDYLQKTLIYFTPDIYDQEVFDTRQVETGEPAPWPLAKEYNNTRLSSPWLDSLESYETSAFLVIHRDSLLYENFWHDHSATTTSNPFSVTKSIVSLLVGCAIDDGYLAGLDEKVKNYLPWLKGPFSDDLTIRHLLTMSSASNWNESYSSPFSITTRAYYGRNMKKTIRKIEIEKQPGIVFSYRSGDTQLLAAILKEATGMNLSEYASRELWQPLGAEAPAYWSLDRRDGIEKAFCCFNSTVRDFARVGALVLNKGTFNGKRIVPEQYIEEITTPVKYLTNDDAKMVNYYGLHWWIMHHGEMQVPYARGLFGQYIYVVPEHDAVIVRIGHERSKNYQSYHPEDAFTWLEAGLEIVRQNQ